MGEKDTAQLLRRLRQVGQRRADADQARREAAAELAQLVRAAKDAGVPIAQIAREAQLSRQGVYDFLDGHG